MAWLRPSDVPNDWLGRLVLVEVDRPMGSRHPRFADCVYPVNYGHVPGTFAADGHEIDAYLVGPRGPVERLQGRYIAIIQRFDDIEDKLVVAPDGQSWTKEAIRRSVYFQERYFQTAILI